MKSTHPKWQRSKDMFLFLMGLVLLMGVGTGTAATVPLVVPQSDDLAPESRPHRPSSQPKRQKKREQPEEKEEQNSVLLKGFVLMERGKFAEAEDIFRGLLKEDPGNPLALNNLAALMVKKRRFDQADRLLNRALPKAKGYMIQTTKIVVVGGICVAFKPASVGSSGQQELEPLIKINIRMIKDFMSRPPVPVR